MEKHFSNVYDTKGDRSRRLNQLDNGEKYFSNHKWRKQFSNGETIL